MRFDLSRQASAKIDDIIRHTDQQFGTGQTDDYIRGLFYCFDLLADNPKLGRERAAGRRRYVYRLHYVFYRLIDNRVLITDIRSTRQRLPDE